MDIQKIYDNYESHTKKWLAALKEYDNNSFSLKPSGNDWSIAQVYDHLYQASEKCLENSIGCANNNGQTGHSGIGPAIFSMMGAFPPIKLKINKIPKGLENIYNPRQISKEEAQKKLEGILQKMKNAIHIIQKAEEKQRIKHWAGGWFNSHQWYHSAEMHLKHHFRQKKRIDKFLPKKK